MPSTGGPSSSSSVRSSGASSEYTEAGPPERTSARGVRSRIAASGVSWGRSSANTPHSRIRRAMSCEYCPPKSRTSTSSSRTRTPPGGAAPMAPTAPSGPGRSHTEYATPASGASAERESSLPGTARTSRAAAGASVIRDRYRLGDRGAPVRAHPDRLLALELLSLRLEGRRHHHLCALEVADVLVAAGRHRRPERAEQVEGAIVLVRRAEEDLLHRAVLAGGDSGAAREGRMEGRHSPVEPAPRSFLGARERRADHHGIGTARDRLRDVAAGAHPAVGDDVAVLAGLEHVLRAGGRDVDDRGRLRNADPEHAARRAGGARADADEDADGAGAHEVQARRVRRAPADDARHRHLGGELLEVERRARLIRGHVLGRDHRALDHEDVEPGLERELVA